MLYIYFQIENGVVLCYKPGEMNQTLIAFIMTDKPLNQQQIVDELKDTLASYMIPQVILVEKIPLLINGKIDKQYLLKIYEKSQNDSKLFSKVRI